MPIKRIPMTISFPNKEDKQEAIDICMERDESVSEHIQKHFKELRRRKK